MTSSRSCLISSDCAGGGGVGGEWESAAGGSLGGSECSSADILAF